MQDYPRTQILAEDVTQYETGCVVELRYETVGNPLPNVSEQDIIDVVKAFLAQQSNVAVTATRYQVTTSTV